MPLFWQIQKVVSLFHLGNLVKLLLCLSPILPSRKQLLLCFVLDPEGIAFIKASFNNTLITLTDKFGNAITWASAGELGFIGDRKSTPFAATQAATKAAEDALSMGLMNVEVRVKGPGGGREAGS